MSLRLRRQRSPGDLLEPEQGRQPGCHGRADPILPKEASNRKCLRGRRLALRLGRRVGGRRPQVSPVARKVLLFSALQPRALGHSAQRASACPSKLLRGPCFRPSRSSSPRPDPGPLTASSSARYRRDWAAGPPPLGAQDRGKGPGSFSKASHASVPPESAASESSMTIRGLCD